MKRSRMMIGPEYMEPVWLWTNQIDGAVNGSAEFRKEAKKVIQPVELENKVALIVGGASDKGNTLAVSFAERGMDIAIIYYEDNAEKATRVCETIEEMGRQCLLLRGEGNESLDQDIFAQWAVDRILETFGRLDVFINVSEKRFSMRALNGERTETNLPETAGLFPHFRIMKAALDEIVS